MKNTLVSGGEGKTKKRGGRLALKILRKKGGDPAVLGLVGDLGGGKTTFLQGFAKGLGIKERILSPTFIIMKKFEIPARRNGKKDSKSKVFYHFDCYRVGGPSEISDLDFKNIIKNPLNIVAVEWADIVKKIMPENALWAKFIFVDIKRRKISFSKQ